MIIILLIIIYIIWRLTVLQAHMISFLAHSRQIQSNVEVLTHPIFIVLKQLQLLALVREGICVLALKTFGNVVFML